MAKTETEQVSDLVAKHEPSIQEILEALRKTVLGVDKEIAEQVKWNSPSFYFTGEMKPFNPKEYKRDIVVVNLHKGRILLVFPTGARIEDTSEILQGEYKDGRRLVPIEDMKDFKKKIKGLQHVIREWLKTIEK
jgi:hypothetical protein